MNRKVISGDGSSKLLPIVAIGASAGGLKAMKEFLENLPDRTGMAYIFIQHLDPTHDSSLTPILQRSTKMNVTEVEDMVKIEANHLFIIPPDKSMTIADGVLKLSDRAPRPVKHSPIDYFFLSLAENKKDTAVGIVLSGAASDGAVGLKAIKVAGGLTFAQDESAEFQSMPRAAIAEGAVDAILSPKAMAKELERLSKQSGLVHALIKDEVETNLDDDDFEDQQRYNTENISPVLQLIKTGVGVDFTHYKENTIRRRIIRRMILNKFEKLTEYQEHLKKNPDEVSLLYKDLLINVTHFFRDAETVDYLKKNVLPELVKTKSKGSPLRIWIAACSTGEEAYSLAILLLEVLGDEAAKVPIQIFASDLSEHAIAKARVGVYTVGDVMQVSAKRLQRFFVKVDGHYRIVKQIRDLCVFTPHNVFKDPPFSRMDLISCCNLLIYLDTFLQKKILTNFHYALNKDGFLVVGKSETTASCGTLFTHLNKKAKVYQKRNDVNSKASFDLGYIAPDAKKAEQTISKKIEVIEQINQNNLNKVIDTLLLTEYIPPAVIITYDMDIVQFRGSTGMFLEPSPGKASLSLFKMARVGLAIEI
ncbi:MAG TPA: CheR family methyltransferase, partial [Segetibacter sp.]